MADMLDLSKRLSLLHSSRMCVLYDDVGDNRCVIVAPARDITADRLNFILSETGGLPFVAITPERAAAFMLSPMTRRRDAQSQFDPAAVNAQYTSVEAREGVTTGISAADRATTIRILGQETPQPRALVKPGHIFPVATKRGGTLVKATIPEAAVDVVRAVGFSDAALFVDLLDDRGEIRTFESSQVWAVEHKLPIFSISEIIKDRLVREPLISRLSEATIPTRYGGDVRAIAYRSELHEIEHVVLLKGEIDLTSPVLVRVQVEHTLADVFGGSAPSSRQQIANALAELSGCGAGILLYLRRAALHDCPVFQKAPKSDATDASLATSTMREYGVGAQILRDLGVSRIELLSSTHRTLVGLESFGITVASQRPIPERVVKQESFL